MHITSFCHVLPNYLQITEKLATNPIMTAWLILEFERDRETVVARNMNRLGLIYYLPLETRVIRPYRNAPQAKSILKDHPLLPGTLFLREGHETARKALSTQYTDHIVCDAFEKPILVPEYQVLRFQAAILEWNDDVARKWQKGQIVKTADRNKFVKLSYEVLADYKDKLFGKALA